MLVPMWLGLGIAAALAGPGDFGKKFTVSFADQDGIFEQQTPRLRILASENEFLRVSLLDDGSSGDAEAGDAIYSGTVSELPDSEVVLVLDGPTGEIWRQVEFSVPAAMQYQALRLVLKRGVVEGELQADLSPDEQQALDLHGHAPNRGEESELTSPRLRCADLLKLKAVALKFPNVRVRHPAACMLPPCC